METFEDFRIMKYYVITDINIANELFNTFNFYIKYFGISLIFIVYYYYNSLISKRLTSGKLFTGDIYVNSIESIDNYFNDIKYKYKCLNALYFDLHRKLIKENEESVKLLFPPINNLNDEYEYDNGWDIAEEINPCKAV